MSVNKQVKQSSGRHRIDPVIPVTMKGVSRNADGLTLHGAGLQSRHAVSIMLPGMSCQSTVHGGSRDEIDDHLMADR